MNNEKKFDAVADYLENIIKKSWTWEKLTTDEREKFLGLLYNMQRQNHIQGTNKQKQVQTMNYYNVYLAGIGCSAFNWRE